MPTVAIYFDWPSAKVRKLDFAVHWLEVYLPGILADTLSTREENVIILPPQKMDKRDGPKIFIDILVKDRPDRASNLKKRHAETCRRLVDALSHEDKFSDFENIGLRIVLAPLEYGTLASS